MTKLFNQSAQKQKRRDLRKEMTSAEGIVWSQIRNHQIDHKFRRQFSIGAYVADFYCSELKLVIEIDGGQHFEDEAIDYDKARTKYFNDLGITVARYTNADVKRNLISVMDDLLRQCKTIKNIQVSKSTPPRPSPC
ncbi:MAG: endonuclease domain-containing protein [Candidatus Moranbacteria bacterium]|nr:endonuclease domain-containing protein [Candidatus Moranbacteria bacterium]